MTAKRSVLALAIALVAALFALPAPALAADGQIQVSVPTKVPCYVSASGMVTAPSNWEIRKHGLGGNGPGERLCGLQGLLCHHLRRLLRGRGR